MVTLALTRTGGVGLASATRISISSAASPWSGPPAASRPLLAMPSLKYAAKSGLSASSRWNSADGIRKHSVSVWAR